MRESYQASEEDVLTLLRKKGYNFLVSKAYAVQLTKPNPLKRFAQTGTPYQEPLGGVSKSNYEHILRWALDAEEAASQIERLCLGMISVPEVGPRQQNAPAQIDEKAIEKLAKARAESIASQALAEVGTLKAQLQAELAEVRKFRDEMSEQMADKPKRGRPRGSKNKPKGSAYDRELTPDEQAIISKVKIETA